MIWGEIQIFFMEFKNQKIPKYFKLFNIEP